MLLFVGLGNPGRPYAGNRHNIGFMAIEAIARAHSFPVARSKYQALTTEGTIAWNKEQITLSEFIARLVVHHREALR